MKTFVGGVHPPDMKELAKGREIVAVAPPPEVAVPLAQHLGRPAAPAVQKGAEVLLGQLIGEATGFVSAAIHSPVSGKVKAIEKRPDLFGRRADHVVIENDGQDRWVEGLNSPDRPAAREAKAIRQRVQEAGLVGMGGATFPTHVKLSPPENKPIDTAILNGAECEPYLTCDYRLMLSRAADIVEGLELVMTAVGAARGVVGIEANKPDAAEALRAAIRDRANLAVEPLKVKYPQGGEKQLIYALTGRQVPSGGLPMDVGAIVHNVGTALAIQEAVTRNKPLVERVLTVSGDGVANPGNFLVRIGTPIGLLLERCGLKPETKRLISGGPMMGIAQFRLDLPVTKGTSGLLALTTGAEEEWEACIRCGRCLEHCPQWLNPSRLAQVAEARREDLFKDYEFLDCMECGVCTYVCPAKRPIVQFVKYAKEALRRLKAAQEAK